MLENKIDELIVEYKDRIKSGKHWNNYLSEDIFYKRIIRDLRRIKNGNRPIKFDTLWTEEEVERDFKEIKKNRDIKKHKKTYIIKENNTGLYKIGKSVNPKYRERTLQSQTPNIEIVKIWDKDIESKLHNKYNENRIRGEWFNLTKSQLKYICTHY